MFSPWKKMLLLLLVIVLGAPWGFLQSVAWLSMLANYSRQGSFVQAVAMTFDGKHPCPLCKAVQQGRAEQQRKEPKQASPQDELQLGLPPEFAFVILAPPAEQAPDALAFASTRTESPPFPPPRPA